MENKKNALMVHQGDDATLETLLVDIKAGEKGCFDEEGIHYPDYGHLKRDCLKKKSSGFIKKGKRDHDFDSPDDKGNVYFREALVVTKADNAVAQRCLEDKQLKEKTNTDCLVNEHEKVHLGIKVRANMMVTRVPGQEGAESNVDEKKNVKEYIEANLEKLLKYNAWLTRVSSIRGSSMRK
nr:hypothetical protein [Tanacetum cinerariifolium]